MRKASDSADYDLYRAALEWDLTEPIIIESREDLHSEHQWKEKLEPYHHQVTNLITFCRRLPVTLLADDVGLGKTISAGLVASELISRRRISKILIVCPKLLMPQWQEELDIKFGIPATVAVGKEVIEAKPPKEPGAVITTYDSARLYLDSLAKTGFEMLVLDEAHKLRNLYGVEKPPQRAIRFRQALADRVFKYVLMLTATPIQNRLWDLYSLIDLLTVARGHENPFGSEGMFTRKFIADGKTQARHLKTDMQDEFRSIVYGYLSRVRRADANLHFPDRKVQLHKVKPSAEELELIRIIAEPIQKLNRLAQISILQALVSSPDALAAQLNNMARNGTIPSSVAADVQAVVKRSTNTAKLQGLATLLDKLKSERPDRWRAVIFTTRRETQTTIEAFLGERHIPCGLINGDSGTRNQQTIARFKKDPPEIHVIVSTEAGSEGVNLQAANVVVNFDLPWNPMVVEQRIGRIQRLASEHASVCIFNVILKGTFEEYIVGRLMEKLQMASHAIGDLDCLLEAAGMNEDEDESESFTEKIRQLVVESLAGKNVEEAVKLAEKSISEAKTKLETEEENINTMLSGMDGAMDSEPKAPRLPPVNHSMDSRTFTLSALEKLGARLSSQPSGLYLCEQNGSREVIGFSESDLEQDTLAILYGPGTPPFDRLVSRIAGEGCHLVTDSDRDIENQMEDIAQRWIEGFGGAYTSLKIKEVWRCFSGSTLLRVRATVAHDSYERLIEVSCSPDEHRNAPAAGIELISQTLGNPSSLGVNTERLTIKAMEDSAISEFCRFYQERMEREVKAAGEDLRKKKKLQDDFTPRVEMSLVGLQGAVHREVKLRVFYKLQGQAEYESDLVIAPSRAAFLEQPETGLCAITQSRVPRNCLARCEVSGKEALRHLLGRSATSGRLALPEHMRTCALSGNRVLSDEIETSAISDRAISKTLLRTSAASGKRAEPEFFGKCEFTSADVLQNELSVSQVSGKRYRSDEQGRSIVSGKTGHKLEFIVCPETNRTLLATEAEHCEITGKAVVPGLLETCEISGKKVIPPEILRCAATGKKGLKKFFVTSSLSGANILEKEAVRSVAGRFCAPLEAKRCLWSGRLCHPDDLRKCNLTGIATHAEFIESGPSGRLEVLVNLLDGARRKTDKTDLWETIASDATKTIGRASVESAELSPDGNHLAVCLEAKSWLGLKIRQAGLLYSIRDKAMVGQIVVGRRQKGKWIPES